MSEQEKPQGIGQGEQTEGTAEREMQTNDTLDAICDRISTAQPNWELLSDRLHRSGSTQLDSPGPFGELLLGAILEELAASDAFKGKIELNPIPPGTKTTNYTFRPVTLGGIEAMDNSTGNRAVEYDKVIRVGEEKLPVVMEVKVISPNQRRKSAKEKSSLAYTYSEERRTNFFKLFSSILRLFKKTPKTICKESRAILKPC